MSQVTPLFSPLSTHQQPSSIDISSTLASSSKVLQVHRQRIKRHTNTVTPLANIPSLLATVPSPLATVQSPLATVPLPLATVSDDDVEEIAIPLNEGANSVHEVRHVWGEEPVGVVSTDHKVTNHNLFHKRTSSILPINDHIPSHSLSTLPPVNEFVFDTSLHNTHQQEMNPIKQEMKQAIKEEMKEEMKQEMNEEVTEEGVTQEELIEYQSFLNKLHSSSTGNVITVAPAPTDKRSSYLKHKKSKVGVANVISKATSTGYHSNKRNKSKSNETNNTTVPQSKPMETIQVHVIPLESTHTRTEEIITDHTKTEPHPLVEPRPSSIAPHPLEPHPIIIEPNPAIVESQSCIVEECDSPLKGEPLTVCDIEEECTGMPLLRVKSITNIAEGKLMYYSLTMNCILLEIKFQTKRKRSLPSYVIHCSPDTVLPPPCPLYGTVHPTDKECKILIIIMHLLVYANY